MPGCKTENCHFHQMYTQDIWIQKIQAKSNMKFSEVFFGREHFEPLCAVLDFLAVYVQRWIFWTACFGIFLEVPFFIMGFYSVHNNKTSDWIHWPIKPCKKFANVYNASLVCKWRPSFAQASAFSAAAWKEVSFTMVPDQRSFDTSAAF